MLLILVGKWVLQWWGLRWWVRKLTHPTREVAMGSWWVRKLTHPTREVAMGSWWEREAYPP